MIKIGCDPEVFLKDRITGAIVSAYGLFPGTKEEPFPVDKGGIQVDGNALEFNIDPAESEDDFVTNIQTVMAQMRDIVESVDPNLEIVFEPVARFDPRDWAMIPFEAKVLGCDPDYNTDGTVKDAPDILMTPIRTGSGHVHIGYDGDQEDFNLKLRLADHVSTKLMCIAEAWETEDSKERRKYYGNRAHRPKPYGIEERSLDNIWLTSEEYMRQVYRTTVSATEDVLNGSAFSAT